MFTRGALSSLAFALILLQARPSLAQPEGSAQRVYQQGVAAFEVRDFETALARFQRAYVLTRRPGLLMNVAVTFERLNRRDDAIATYRNYLAIGAPSDRATAEASIARLEGRPLAEPVAEPVAAPVAAPVATPVAEPVATPTSRHSRSSAHAHGHAAPVAPPVVAPVLAPSIARPSPWPYIALGAGGLVAVVGVALMVVPPDPGTNGSISRELDYLAARDARTNMQIAGAALGAVGVVGAAVGAIGLLLRHNARVSRLSWSPGLRPIEGGALVGVSHAF